jgi:phosphoglucomutase
MAGRTAPASVLIDTDKLIDAYWQTRPDPGVAAQRVVFGTSGHRGSALDASFNEWHVLAITQAICDHRREQGIQGPLFMGLDTHALSAPAGHSALEVLAANGVHVVLAAHKAYTPTPVISHAIITHNRAQAQASALEAHGSAGKGASHMNEGGGGDVALVHRVHGTADGMVITPSHNPPRDGGLKYNPPHGGPAGQAVSDAIQASANRYLAAQLRGVARMPYAQALNAPTTHHRDYMTAYVDDLDNVIDMAVIRGAKLRIGVDPMGGAGVHYWRAIANRWQIDLTVVSETVDSRFAFMSLDWDGLIRMDPSSAYAMAPLVAIKDQFDLAFACDTDHDRHGIVTPTVGLMPPNHFLAVAIDYLFQHRPLWGKTLAVGKTVVSTQLIDRVAQRLHRPLFETPVGFKWFAQGLLDERLGFAGEESAGATFLRRDATTWTTDKDGIVAALLAAEITARCGHDPGVLYRLLASELGNADALRIDAPATLAQQQRLAALTPQAITSTTLAGEPITSVANHTPGNGAPIGGVKVQTDSGWYAARPSGTEAIYKLYAESFQGPAHLQQVLAQGQAAVDQALGAPTHRPRSLDQG